MAEGKSPAIVEFLDSMTKQMFGRSRSASIANKVCVTCGGPAINFTDAMSYKEYGISGTCQPCQDKLFGATSNYVNQD
jgi:uncharacterized CHY-type Zn-finger protein